MSFKLLFHEIGISGLFDIFIVAFVLYFVLIVLKRTHRSGLILTGLLSIGAVYLVARKFNLLLTETLLGGFFAVILVAFIIIFQEDLRYFLERVGQWWIERRLPIYRRTSIRLPRIEAQALVHALTDLAQEKVGALVVIKGQDSIARHLHGGQKVEALLSEVLLKSIFDPNSDGHDGAVIIEGHRIDRLGCYLPLSKNLVKLPVTGTRHAAALGLSELTDALCVIVSEEKGTISVARHGDFQPISSPAELGNVLERFYNEIAPRREVRPWTDFLRRNYREKLIALLLAAALWVIVVQQSQVIGRDYEIPVSYALVPEGLEVASVNPSKVKLTFAAKRKDFGTFGEQDVKLVLNLWDAKKGRQVYPISSNTLSYPNDFELENVTPRHVVLEIRKKPIVTDTMRTREQAPADTQ